MNGMSFRHAGTLDDLSWVPVEFDVMVVLIRKQS
jgi:hypothetical protein